MARALRGELPEVKGRVAKAGGVIWVVPQRIVGGDAPALDRLQVRAEGHGRLSLSVRGHEVAGRSITALPERRLLLPLPVGDAEVRLG
jgi:hypothetical protein